MTTCDECGAKYESERVFCGKCRCRLGVRCGYCGFINSLDDTYCGGCSTDLQSGQFQAEQTGAEETKKEKRAFYDDLMDDAHHDRSFTAQIAETLNQAEIKELFKKEDPRK